MRASKVREHLASIPVGEFKRILPGFDDTPRSLRNYFLVIAKLEGYVIRTIQYETEVGIWVDAYNPSAKKEPKKDAGLNGYYRKKNESDFNWPVLRLCELACDMSMTMRVDLTPKPIAGATVKPVGFNRGNSNGFKSNHEEDEDDE